MASKLEYLKKYLAKPSEAVTDAKPVKEKKKRKKGAVGAETMQIRDLSEALPKPRMQAEPVYGNQQAKLLALDLDEDEARLARDGELGFVEAEMIEEASKAISKDVEKSGIGWKISNHRNKPNKQALRAPLGSRKAEVKAEVVKEEVKAEEASDDDMSPPRGAPAVSRAQASSPPRSAARKDGDSDISPPRGRQRHDSDGDLSPPRAAAAQGSRHDSDADLSPPRGAPAVSRAQASSPPRSAVRKDGDSDISPPRGRQRHDSDADLSPPRAAAPQGRRHDSDADLSPPRGATAQGRRHDSDADLSPPRGAAAQGRRHDSDADLSPPRKEPAKRQRHDSDADISPPRQGGRARHDSDADMSPPRRGPRKDRGEVDENGEERMSSGLRSGLVKGSVLREEAAKVREERKAALAAAPDSETGKGAETVYRNRAGGKIGREEWVEQQQKKRKKKMSEYPEQELAWGGGLKQQSNKEQQKAEALEVAAEPFARYEPTAKAIEESEQRKSWHDPMAKFNDEDDALGPAARKKEAPEKKKPKCPHPPWPNRFGILPGYRWDGAVRGNNYEKRWLQSKNNREFRKTEQYKAERLED